MLKEVVPFPSYQKYECETDLRVEGSHGARAVREVRQGFHSDSIFLFLFRGTIFAVSGYRAAERGNNNHPTKYQSPAHQGTLAQNRTILHAINKNMMYLWRL